MIHIDGAQKSGSGTIVRFAGGLATLLGEELHLTNIRARREKPGLTGHVETNLWLAETILGARAEVKNDLVRIQGVGYSRSEGSPRL